MRIEEIQVVGRHRKDLGDLSGLAASIRERALLHPPAVTPGGRLIAGQRRLEACRMLGWTDVPVTVVSSLTEMQELLEAERDENTERLPMKPSEKVALAEALAELERPLAKARQGTRTDIPGDSPGMFEKPRYQREVRDIAAKGAGMSGFTYQRAKAVVQAAEAGDPVAQEALDEMDRTGKVLPAYEKVAAKPAPTRDGSRKRRSTDLVSNVVDRLSVTPMALRELDIASAISDPDAPLAEWDRKLTEVIQSLHRLRTDIRKEMSK